MKIKEPPITDAEVKARQARNERRASEAIAQLGTRYVCHPVHPPRRLATQPGVLRG